VREEGSEVEEVRTGYRMEWGGVQAEICPHGRPIAKHIKLADLPREFGRA
jgi:hypothetical protein